jgi:hypothetical protein
MITKDYMRDILCGKTFCPHYKDVKLLPCPRPPPVELLLRKFYRICESFNLLNNCGVDELRLPDKRWLLGFLSTFKPDGEILWKDYRPPANSNKLLEMKTVDVNKSFFEKLVLTKNKVRRRASKSHRKASRGRKNYYIVMMS